METLWLDAHQPDMVVSPEEIICMGVTESTRFAVLSLTLDGPTYSYAIAEELRRWPLDEAIAPNRRAVYHAVDWLVAEGMVVQSDDEVLLAADGAGAIVAVRGAPRKLVEATPLGVERFRAWLESPILEHDDLPWRVGSARLGDLPALIRLLDDAERTWLARLQDQATPNAAVLAERQRSWRLTRHAVLDVLRGKQLDGQVAVIRDVRALLSELRLDADEIAP
jgi:DNA-binding PadR family transcriptional regulator